MLVNKPLDKSVSQRYIIALTLIAVLSTTAYYLTFSALTNSKSTGYIVNISGKQRMLSQHIALDAYRIIKQFRLANPDNANLRFYRQVLKEHTQAMLKANKMLSTGHFSAEKDIVLSATISSMYFGELDIAQRVKDYALTAEKLLNSHSLAKMDQVIKVLDEQSEPLLKDLNKVVLRYQLEGEEKLEKIELFEEITWLSILITILLEVILIFQPMVRKIMFLSKENEYVLTNLEHLVELKTRDLAGVNHKLQELASRDPLTNLLNRLNLETDIEKAIEYYHNHHSPYALLMFDIDWFKQVNDNYGHDMGDFVLTEFANILRTQVREEDKVYRAGGEEFVILLNRISFDDSVSFAEKIRLLIQDHDFKKDEVSLSKTVSIGLFHSSIRDVADVKMVLKLIDKALYTSKTNGRNRVTVINDEMTNNDEKDIACTTLVFSDLSLEHVIESHVTGEPMVCLNGRALLLGKTSLKSFVHSDDQHLLDDISFCNNEPWMTTIRLLDDNEHIHICKVEASQQKGRIFINFQEVTELANSVVDSTLVKNLHSMLEMTNDFIYFKDRNHVFTAASKSLVSLTSINKREDLIGKTDYQVFEKVLADEYFKLERNVFDRQHEVSQELQPIKDEKGNKAWVDNRKYPIMDEQNNIIGLFGIARVISDYEHKSLKN